MKKDETKSRIIPARIAGKLLRDARRLARQITDGLGDTPPGWSVASYDPNRLLGPFSCLRLRDGFRLAAYQFHDGGGNGNGFVAVIPDDRSLPDPPESGFDFAWSPPGSAVLSSAEGLVPEWVRLDIGHFLEGDDSPLSYFQASILLRELGELGAMWHGCSWATHELVTSHKRIPGRGWKWKRKEPQEWQPVVRRNRVRQWQVIFYTKSDLGQSRVVRHRDTFTDVYNFDSEEVEIALGRGDMSFSFGTHPKLDHFFCDSSLVRTSFWNGIFQVSLTVHSDWDKPEIGPVPGSRLGRARRRSSHIRVEDGYNRGQR